MTGLTALNSFFLSWLPLAALPVIFHLLFRMKAPPRVFSTLMFFNRIDPRFNARRKVREWLILALRVLMILFLILALAHPVCLGLGQGSRVATVLVIDNSGSMSGTGSDGRTKLKQSVVASRELVAQLHDRDSAAIVLQVSDPLVPLPLHLTSDKEELRNALDHITETEASGSVAAALEKAESLLQNSTATRFEIHLFSDLQEEKWNQMPVNLHNPRPGTSLIVHRVPSPNVPRVNASIKGIRPLSQVALSGRKLPVEINLANYLFTDAPVHLNWTTDEGKHGSEEVDLSPNSEKTVTVTLDPSSTGEHWADFDLSGDDFEADNQGFLSFRSQEVKNVTFMGEPADFGLLPLALSPEADGALSGLKTTFTDKPDFSGNFVVMTWDALSTNSPLLANDLKSFLSRGGSALILPSAGASTALSSLPAWIASVPKNQESTTNGIPLIALDKENGVFGDLHDQHGDVALHNIRAFHFQPLSAASNATPVLGLENGQALLSEQKIGKGHLFMSGLAFDSASSTLVMKPAFIALAQNLVLFQDGNAQDHKPVVAGDPLQLALPTDKSLRVRSLAGSPLDWEGLPSQLRTLPRAGVYQVTAASSTNCLAIRSSDEEGHQTFITGNKLPALGSMTYAVNDLKDVPTLVSEFHRLDRSLDLSPLLLLLALLSLIGEGLLANPASMKARLGEKSQSILKEETVVIR